MMKNVKKWTTLTLCSAVLLTAAACGNGSTNSSEPSTSTPKSDQPVTIKFYNWNTNEDLVKKVIADFEKENSLIKVESVVLVPGGNATDNMKKLDVLMSAGENVDVFLTPNKETTALRISTGVIEPLDEYLKKDNINVKDEFLSVASNSGKVYSLPSTANYWLVAMNKKHLEEAGLPIPALGWTWDDYREYAKKLTKGQDKDKRYGTYFHNWGEYANPMLYSEKAHPYLNEQNTPIFDDKSFDYWFNLRRVMEKDDKSAKPLSDVIGAKLSYKTEFFNEKTSMMMIGSFILSQVSNPKENPNKIQTVYAPLPRLDKNSPIGPTNIAFEYVNIGKSSKNKEAAYKFAKYIATTGSTSFGLSAWKKADSNKQIEAIVGTNKELYDTTSIKNALFDPKITAAGTSEVALPYEGEFKNNVLVAGFNQYMLDNKTTAEVKKWMMDEANKIIKNNTK